MTKSCYVNRSTVLLPQYHQYVTSSEQLTKITVNQLKFKHVGILVVFKDKLLVSSAFLTQLFIYGREGRHLSTIKTNGNDKLCDATWTPRGNILYTSKYNENVMMMSESGKKNTTQILKPQGIYFYFFSVSNDKIIYVTSSDKSVYQSTDDGVSWSLVLKFTGVLTVSKVIKVVNNYSDDFWTIAKTYDDNSYWHLRVYSVDSRRSDDNVTWRSINVTTAYGEEIYLDHDSYLSYDGNINIFLFDSFHKAIYVLSVNEQYNCQLLSSHYIKDKQLSLAVDMERQLLYVGQWFGIVEVFKLTHGDGGNCYT